MPKRPARRPPRRDGRPARAIFWPFPLFGNPGGDAGVGALHDALCAAAEEWSAEPGSRQHALARRLAVEAVEFLDPEDLLDWRVDLRRRFEEARAAGELPVVFGANHLVALPALDAYAESRERVLFLSFDAHLDAYDLAASRERIHHGNFLLHARRRAGLAIANVGHRDHVLRAEEVAAHFDRAIGIDEVALRPLAEVAKELADLAAAADVVHLDIDLDVLDPAAFPAVGTPMPCGLTAQQLLALVLAGTAAKLGAITFSEYAASADLDGAGRSLVIWLIEHLLLRD
jgi:arginase family enzyme